MWARYLVFESGEVEVFTKALFDLLLVVVLVVALLALCNLAGDLPIEAEVVQAQRHLISFLVCDSNKFIIMNDYYTNK